MRWEYKVSSSGWLCIRTGKGDVYGWQAVCKLTSEQLEKLKEFL